MEGGTNTSTGAGDGGSLGQHFNREEASEMVGDMGQDQGSSQQLVLQAKRPCQPCPVSPAGQEALSALPRPPCCATRPCPPAGPCLRAVNDA